MRLLRRGDPLVPPRKREVLGHADFAEAGEGLLRACVDEAGLAPDQRVLEVGCGHGRLARALHGFLGADGRYAGLDADADAVGWCRRAYARDRRFSFGVLVDPALPHPDGAFDVAVVTLVDALPDAAEARLAEARRVARTVVACAFVLDEQSRAAITAGQAGLLFPEAGEPVALLDETVPDEAVAYEQAFFGPEARVRPGRWRGVEATTFEDVVCA